MRRPNILFIFPDQHRADTLGCAGHPIVRTPNIDRLASEGAHFRRAYTQSPLCIPARAALIAGRYPHETGSIQNDANCPGPEAPNFLHQLQAAGYTTALIGKSHIGYTPQHTSVREPRLRAYGFDHAGEESGKMSILLRSPWTDHLRERGIYKDFRRDVMERLAKGAGEVLAFSKEEVAGLDLKQAWYAAPSPATGEDYIDNFVGDRMVRWLREYDDRDGERPFFLWAGFCGPHDPWDAPQEFADPYLARLDEIPLDSATPPEATPSASYNALINWVQHFCDTESLTLERVRRVRAFYYASVTLIDRRIGDLLRVLDERGWAGNTWVVYASDHGEFAGHHSLLAKGVMYETAMRVPLIVRPPKGIAPLAIDDAVELNDVAATMLDAAGAEPVEGSHARSLLPALEGSSVARQAVFSELSSFTTVVAGRYKYVVERQDGKPCALFDLEADPQENINLAADPDYEDVRSALWRDRLQPFLDAN